MENEIKDEVYLIGFRLNIESKEPEFYTLLVYADKDFILNDGTSLIFYQSLDQTPLAFSMLPEKIKAFTSPPGKMEEVFDLAESLYRLENENTDSSAGILFCLNTLFDLFSSLNIAIPDERKQVLHELADSLTFDEDFSKYLESSSRSREQIIDALLWCCGRILSRSKLLS